jgi:M6 family metalloprotease-like protein
MLVLSSCELVIGTNGIYINRGEITTTTTTTTTTNDGGDDNPREDYTYISFTTAEKELFEDSLGVIIPFLPNDKYYLEEYDYTYENGKRETGLNYYVWGKSDTEFDAYRSEIASLYDFEESYEDDYGDTWYIYAVSDEAYLDISYYEAEDGYVVDVYVYYLYDETSGGSDSDSTDIKDIFTNDGAGLPEGTNGVFNVDFRKAEKFKNVRDLTEYLNGCPTTGSPAVLVIPVQFSDVTAKSKGYSTDVLVDAFSKGGDVDYYSVYDYYFISSYGQLTLDITVLDEWFTPKYNSSYYYNATYNKDGEEVMIGDQLIMDEALDYLADIMDLTQFDSDDNGLIDSIVLINTLEVGREDFYWAYRDWNYYLDDNGSYYTYDDVRANDYVWASYQFLYEGYDEEGYIYYEDTSLRNTYTFIHEFGHVLGADDYYDYTGIESPLDNSDIMDSLTGDHNAYTKFNYGWLTASRLVVTDSSVTLKLEDFSNNGDTIIIANNWDEKLGVYQEYYILMYYTNNGLNSGEGYGYFDRDGVVVYHVNSSIALEDYKGEDYYHVHNSNTDSSIEGGYGTEDNLIEFVKSANDTFTYIEGDTLPSGIELDNGEELAFTFVIDALTSEYATITFTAK